MLSVRTYLGGAAFAATVIAAVTTVASAQDKRIEPLQWVPEMRAAIDACMADQARLCGDVVPGHGRIVCLASQGGRLSLACATAMQKASDALIAAGVTMNPGLISQ